MGKQEGGLWDEYCSFFEKDFEEQLEYNRKRKEEFFEKWRKTKTADHLLPEGPKRFEDIPVTTYEDYPALQKFGRKMEKKVDNNPKPGGMSWKTYYEKMEKGLKDWIEDWIPGEYGICAKTTGSTGRPKWFAMGKEFMREFREEAILPGIFSGSEERGRTNLQSGDVLLNLGVPVPYIAGYTILACKQEFTPFPSIKYTDNELNMKRKLNYILKKIKQGQEIHFGGGSASTFQLFVQAVISPEKTLKNFLDTLDFGGKKMIVYLMYLKEKLKSSDIEKAKEVLPLKGYVVSGLDVMLYKDFLTYHFDSPPFNLYASTEMGCIMMGRPNRNLDLLPILKSKFLEFIDSNGEVHDIDDLKKGETYQLIGTPFGTPLVRYNQKDLLRVKEFRDDGMPIFKFEGRKESWLGIRGYFRLSERMAFKVMKKAGFKNTEAWAVTKKIDPNEHLCFLMEEKEKKSNIIKRLYRAMYEISEGFRKYVSDFDIEKPSEVIDVEILSRGTFRRYSLKQMEKDVPIGQYKSPKIISPQNQEIIDSLRRA
ncbi:MAG: GH3 auxin-responsive promoter family protein [Candidatus Thermoplasmatota archaeon]